MSGGRVVSVNVGAASRVEGFGRTYRTAIEKRPLAHAAAFRGECIEGDVQVDRKHHGGFDRAVYAYAVEDYAYWSERLGRPLEPGLFGENLTVAGLAVNDAIVGERWRVGEEVELEVSLPRIPCNTFAAKMGERDFVKTFGAELRFGPYLRIRGEGYVRAGDPIEIVHRPTHGVRIVDVSRIHMFARGELGSLLAAPELGEEYLAWVREQLGHRNVATTSD